MTNADYEICTSLASEYLDCVARARDASAAAAVAETERRRAADRLRSAMSRAGIEHQTIILPRRGVAAMKDQAGPDGLCFVRIATPVDEAPAGGDA